MVLVIFFCLFFDLRTVHMHVLFWCPVSTSIAVMRITTMSLLVLLVPLLTRTGLRNRGLTVQVPSSVDLFLCGCSFLLSLFVYFVPLCPSQASGLALFVC